MVFSIEYKRSFAPLSMTTMQRHVILSGAKDLYIVAPLLLYATGMTSPTGTGWTDWRMVSVSFVKKSGKIAKAANTSIALRMISSMPAMAKPRLPVDLAKIADRIRKIRLTPGMEYNISEPIQFSTEGCLLLLLFAMIVTPLQWTAAAGQRVKPYPYTLYIIHGQAPRVKRMDGMSMRLPFKVK